MLQYSVLYCKRLQEAKLYRNTKLYCDNGLGAGRWLGAGWTLAGRAGGMGAGALGDTGAGARGAGCGAQGVRSRGAAGARPGRWARGLGTQAGQECALSAPDLIFKPIFRLGIFPESVNEHCSL